MYTSDNSWSAFCAFYEPFLQKFKRCALKNAKINDG